MRNPQIGKPMTDFEKSVKIALILKEKRLDWLCAEVTQKTDMYCDRSRLLKVLSGEHNSPKIKEAIIKALDIEEGKKWTQV